MKLTRHVFKLNHRSTTPQIMFVLVNLPQPSTVLFVLLFTLFPSFLIFMCRPSTIRTIIRRSHTLVVLFERSRTQRHRFYPVGLFAESWEWRSGKRMEKVILREKGCLRSCRCRGLFLENGEKRTGLDVGVRKSDRSAGGSDGKRGNEARGGSAGASQGCGCDRTHFG